MKRFAMILLAAVALVGGIGVADAQTRGGSHGGGMQAGTSGHSGGSWSGHSGGSWSGHSGGSWNGGNWHRGNWHGHGSRVFVGVGFGAPWWGWWPGYYPLYYPSYGYYGYYPYADYYPYEYGESSYIQQDEYSQPPSGQRGEYSYYCPDPAGYYPQVQTCAKGWLRVVPQSAPGPGAPGQR